jgi:hypothetical protein
LDIEKDRAVRMEIEDAITEAKKPDFTKTDNARPNL